MINIDYHANGGIVSLQVDLDCNVPQIFVGDQNIGELIHSHNFWEIVNQAKKLAQQEADDDLGEYQHTMGYRKS